MPRHQDESHEGRRPGERGYGGGTEEGRADRRHESDRHMDDRLYEDEPWASRWRGTSGEGERDWASRREPRGGGSPRYIGERGEMSQRYRGDYGASDSRYRGDYGPSERRGDVGQSGYWQSESDWRDQGGVGSEMLQQEGGYGRRESGPGWRQHGYSGWPSEAGGMMGRGERGWAQPSGERGGQRDAWRSGPHTGRGPKGYQRSDERIKEDVCEQLTQHGQIDASEIEIKVSNREVTLTGTVTDRQSKRLAEDVAESVSGVTEVHNQLRVTPEHGAGHAASSGGAKGTREHRAA